MAMMTMAACQPATQTTKAIDPEDMDLTVSPGADFYQYANGGWKKRNPLKGEYARYGSFDVLGESTQEQLNELFQSMTKMNPEKGSDSQKIVDLYKQGLDEARLNEEGAAPIRKYIDQVYAIQSKEALALLVADFHTAAINCFFNTGVSSDMADSNRQVLYFEQSGLGMGDRDYYLEAGNEELRKGYEEMLVKFLTLAGVENAESAAANALAVETRLAKVSWTSVENRDVIKQYNPMSSAEIVKKFNGFDFDSYFNARNIPAQDEIIVSQPSFIDGFAKIFKDSSLDELKDYMAATLVSDYSAYMSDDFYNARFDFFSRQMRGITDQQPRWKRAMSVPDGLLGESVGKMYVEKYFPEEYKQKVLGIVSNLQVALGEHIDALTWMSDETKAYAREKLAKFTVKIGYPDTWKDYSSLEIDPELSYCENIRNATIWLVKDNLDDLGKPTDRDEWQMSPQTVNAYYNPTTNEICFPAAILQPPFFNAAADDAVNYGAIGVVIGHEMTHGFDDQGRLFDKDGNMTNWWTEEDAAAFKAKTDILVKQFDAIEVLPGTMANGSLTLGENIADQGGLGVARSAYLNSLGGNVPEPVDGLTSDQRFFLGYAHVWADNITDEEIARRTKLDVHSLGRNRVNASLRNFQEFFDAFGIKEGDPMWLPESERVMIW